MNERSSPRSWVSSITFSDGQTLAFESTDVVLIVGPNNSGKSAALRGIRDRLQNAATHNPVIKAALAKKTGTTDQFLDWLGSWVMKREEGNPGNPVYHALGHGLHLHQVQADWGRGDGALAGLWRWMCVLLNADERLQISRPASNISLVRDPPSHPIHYLLRDDALEVRLSKQFRKAFGVDLVVHRNAGNQVPLYVGERPTPAQGEDRVSVGFVARVEQLPPLETQGDGMRSFAGVLIATSVGRESIILVDEPEAFLHPPQSRLLGRMLVTDRRRERQLFIATHSSDIIRGVLDVESVDVRVLRLRRNGEVNAVRELKNSRIKELWSDPLLRYSNILDGLVHEHVIVCESDADCRFYGAVLDVLISQSDDQVRRPDIMFTHSGGKARLATVVRALSEVEVPVSAVVDFDVLSDEVILQGLVEALGGAWASIKVLWNTVKTAVDAKKPDLQKADLRKELDSVFDSIDGTTVPEAARDQIRQAMRRSSPWAIAKEVGRAYVPPGAPSESCLKLLNALRTMGLHVVEIGELEGFDRTVGGHGPRWVNAVLAKDLATDPELAQAREFVQGLLNCL